MFKFLSHSWARNGIAQLCSFSARSCSVLAPFTSNEFCERRLRLAHAVAKTHPHESIHLLVIPGLAPSFTAPDVPIVFRQRTNFRYLTGLNEPNCCLIVAVTLQPSFSTKSLIFYESTSEEIRIWEGKRLDANSAVSISGADEAHSFDEFANKLNLLVKGASSRQGLTVWLDDCDVHDSSSGYPPIADEIRPLFNKPMSSPLGDILSRRDVRPLSHHIHRLRVVKSPTELKRLRLAGRAAAGSMISAARSSVSGLARTEFQVESAFEYGAKTDFGCRRLSFPPVVASGERATALHYLTNSERLDRKDLILMDAGVEVDGYSSDMSRVWPIAGTFTKHNRLLYEALLSVHENCIKLIRPGTSLDFVYHSMLGMIVDVAFEIGLLRRTFFTPSSSLKWALARRLCPHHVSHHLGMDVHDCALVSRSEPLMPNSVVTVEPGIYIRPEWSAEFPKEFCGIGMRIEDDLIVPESSSQPAEVLTSDFPRDVDSLELMLSRSHDSSMVRNYSSKSSVVSDKMR